MSFTRSANGIKNYPKFYGASLVFYIEGKASAGEGKGSIVKKTKDEVYYEALLKDVLGHASFKIKTVGNRADVFYIWGKLREKNATDGVAIVDKDLDGILSSPVQVKNLIYTKGYSWENDFWRQGLIEQLVSDLTIGSDEAAAEAARRGKALARRLAKISSLDIAAQFNGRSLIKKNGKSCGVGFDDKVHGLVSRAEFGRVARAYKGALFSSCSATRDVLRKAMRAPVDCSIQGHLWENACIHLICAIYKRSTGAKSAPHEMIANLALSKFSTNPSACIAPEVRGYFSNAIRAALH